MTSVVVGSSVVVVVVVVVVDAVDLKNEVAVVIGTSSPMMIVAGKSVVVS